MCEIEEAITTSIIMDAQLRTRRNNVLFPNEDLTNEDGGVMRTGLLGSVSPNNDILDLGANVLRTFYSLHAGLLVLDLKMPSVHAANLAVRLVTLGMLGGVNRT